MSDPFDLLVTGGRVFDPAAGLDVQTDIGIRGTTIAAIDRDLQRIGGDRMIDANGCLVTPGLVDMHGHFYAGVSEFGIRPDPVCLGAGVTTAVDAGSAGAINFPGFCEYVVTPSKTRILAFVNIAAYGVQGRPTTELRDIAYADPRRTAECLAQYPEVALGVKVRMSHYIVGDNGIEPLHRAVAAAAGSRLMVHIGGSAVSLEAILALLRPGDIVAHVFTGHAPNILDERGEVRRAVREARTRGVVFEVAHGLANCNFDVARVALAQGFGPDVISTDLHNINVHGPVFDLPTTLSKCLALGMSLEAVVLASTDTPARVIGWQDRIGRLAVGREADLAVLAIHEGPMTFHDADGNALRGNIHLDAQWTVRAGEPFPGTHAGAKRNSTA